jgi:hypothetical protein
LGIKDLRPMNVSLLCKWWSMLENEKGLWQEIVKLKYVKYTPICLIHVKQSDSPVWNDLLKIRHSYLKGRKFKVNSGKKVSSCVDAWLEEKPLCVIYPILYDLCVDKNCSMWKVRNDEWVIQFKIILPPLIRMQWYDLARKLNAFQVNDGKDIPVWSWIGNGKFSVKSVYMHLTKEGRDKKFRVIWKSKIHEKIKIFIWLVAHKSILTKDNMLRRKWQGTPNCYFCGEAETTDRLLFDCSIVKVIWGIVAIHCGQNDSLSSYEQF